MGLPKERGGDETGGAEPQPRTRSDETGGAEPARGVPKREVQARIFRFVTPDAPGAPPTIAVAGRSGWSPSPLQRRRHSCGTPTTATTTTPPSDDGTTTNLRLSRRRCSGGGTPTTATTTPPPSDDGTTTNLRLSPLMAVSRGPPARPPLRPASAPSPLQAVQRFSDVRTPRRADPTSTVDRTRGVAVAAAAHGEKRRAPHAASGSTIHAVTVSCSCATA
eukprot:CAMPEP_0119397586 /NCGR_PEP_ID=MMETSP1334-20130426/140411_1 /TAXON_ID=127549 /ORGANISM="Calcidiscus leptoporus, Strain RCC1130" /LENGTH=219 /DNA_ID=CAMNT_0007421431 /DNA_START=103 /DNA_END=763 /DNA_ORIENTATION=-